MVSLTTTGTHVSGLPHASGVSDLAAQVVGGVTYLYTASRADGGMMQFELQEDALASLHAGLAYTGFGGTMGLNQIELAEIDGRTILLPSGSYDNRMALHLIDEAGSFDGTRYLGASADFIGGIDHTQTFQVAGKTFMIASQFDRSGFRAFEIRDDLSMTHKRHFEDTENQHLASISGLASGTLQGRSYFFTISAQEDGVSSYWMGRWGNVKHRDSLSVEDGLWVNAPTAIATAEFDGRLFVIIGSEGSNSITVLRVNSWGGLFVEDHEIDSRATRFADVNAVETVFFEDRCFVLAGGGDDGVTLFELSQDGRLHLLSSLADDLTTTLQNVSAIEAVVVGDDLQIFVAGTQPGITQLSVDLSQLGDAITGNNLDNMLVGGASDDLLTGLDGDDHLDGGAGDDRLIDGAGVDTLFGGEGADVFVFVDDNRMDTIVDFTPGEDKIDMTDFAMLYGMGQLSLVQKGYGVLITFGDDRIRLENGDGDKLTIADLGPGDFIFG